jgi:hypothetical protein
LDVAVHDAGSVRRVERPGHLQDDPSEAIGRERAVVADLGGEVAPSMKRIAMKSEPSCSPAS